MKIQTFNKLKEKTASGVFPLSALASILFVALICIFLFANGIPAILQIGVTDFLFGKEWAPTDEPASYGIFPMILGSVYVTLGALAIGVSIGLLSAIYLSRFCSERVHKKLKPAVDLLAGIPSVVYGFFGLVVIVPFVRQNFGGSGASILAASILLGIMILPLIMRTTEEALKSVPDSYREGSYGLGAGKLRTVGSIVLPAAIPGILAGIILSVGRVVGETAALIYTAGTVADFPKGIFSSGRTLAVHMYELSREGLHTGEAYATSVILIAIVLLINWISNKFANKIGKN